MSLMDFADKIETKDDFVLFLKLFQTDLIHNGGDWENPDLESFLEAMEAFLSGSTEKSLVVFDCTPSWKMFAELLMVTSIYE